MVTCTLKFAALFSASYLSIGQDCLLAVTFAIQIVSAHQMVLTGIDKDAFKATTAPIHLKAGQQMAAVPSGRADSLIIRRSTYL